MLSLGEVSDSIFKLSHPVNEPFLGLSYISSTYRQGWDHFKSINCAVPEKSIPTPWKVIGNSYGEGVLKSQNFKSNV